MSFFRISRKLISLKRAKMEQLVFPYRERITNNTHMYFLSTQNGKTPSWKCKKRRTMMKIFEQVSIHFFSFPYIPAEGCFEFGNKKELLSEFLGDLWKKVRTNPFWNKYVLHKILEKIIAYRVATKKTFKSKRM